MLNILNRMRVLLFAIALILSMTMIFISTSVTEAIELVLKHQIDEQGVALTKAISDSIWKKFIDKRGHTYDEILRNRSYEKINQVITPILEGTPVLKLKLYDMIGNMQYSSNRKDLIGKDGDDLKLKNDINLVAQDVGRTGKPFSSYRYRNDFDSGNEVYQNRYIFSSYLPAFEPNSRQISAVVEIYYDITNIIKKYNAKKHMLNISLASAGIMLFAIISYLIIMNDKIIRGSNIEREEYFATLRKKNHELVENGKELTELKERAVSASEEQNSFMIRIGHELRTPMNAVIGLTDLLLRTDLTQKQRGYISAIQSSGNVLLDITDEMLTVGRLEAGYIEIKNRKFMLGTVIDSVLEVTGNRAFKKGVELFFSYSPALYDQVEGDPVRLRQILINLVVNAIKFTEAGYVSLSVRCVKDGESFNYYHFEIKDTGIGINKEDYCKLFAAYCHLNADKNLSNKNTGLGLAISKRLVESMNGVITVKSEIGQGSVFSVKLPFAPCDPEEIVNNSKNKTEKSRTKVLVVTDCAESGLEIQSMLLNRYSMNTDRAQSVDDALRYIEQSFIDLKPYALFFVDSKINGVDGMELVKAIRNYSAFNDSYIVFLIPITFSLERDVVGKIDQFLCMNKPILLQNLTILMNELLVKGKMMKQNAVLHCVVNKQIKTTGASTPDNQIKHNILIVDDNPINRELVLEMLSELGINAKAVNNGQSTIEACLEEDFDLILLDCHLPDFDGYDITGKIRRLKETSKQPVIIIASSDSSLRNRHLCLESGVDDFLQTPITVSSLVNTLSSWLSDINHANKQDQYVENNPVTNLFNSHIIDKNILLQHVQRDRSNPGFLDKLIDIFLNDSFERIETMKNRLEKSDYTGIERMAHSVKSACLHMGAIRMARYCDVLSNTARNQTYDETSRALQYFSEEFDRALLELRKEQEALEEHA